MWTMGARHTVTTYNIRTDQNTSNLHKSRGNPLQRSVNCCFLSVECQCSVLGVSAKGFVDSAKGFPCRTENVRNNSHDANRTKMGWVVILKLTELQALTEFNKHREKCIQEQSSKENVKQILQLAVSVVPQSSQ